MRPHGWVSCVPVSSAYITLWSQPQIELERRQIYGGDTLGHTANDQFRGVGVGPGDRIYIVGTDQGRLLLLARLLVERVVDQPEAERHFGHSVYEAADHLLGAGTAFRLDRVVPEVIARELQRESGKRIKIAGDEYRVDPGALQRTGRITEDSAALLDALLDEKVRIGTDPPPGMHEGKRQERRHWTIERSSALRTLALLRQGTDCRACGFSFGAVYGLVGEGFAEVHHLAPLASLQGEASVDPVTDVAVLCANCHRMVHREDPPLTPDELNEIVARRRNVEP